MNSLSDMLWFAWPWAGLGGGVVLLILLLFTDVFRSHPNRLRWKDPVWLSWAVAFSPFVISWGLCRLLKVED